MRFIKTIIKYKGFVKPKFFRCNNGYRLHGAIFGYGYLFGIDL